MSRLTQWQWTLKIRTELERSYYASRAIPCGFFPWNFDKRSDREKLIDSAAKMMVKAHLSARYEREGRKLQEACFSGEKRPVSPLDRLVGMKLHVYLNNTSSGGLHIQRISRVLREGTK